VEWLSAIEAAYQVEPDDGTWLKRVLERMSVLDTGLGVVAQVFSLKPAGPELTLAVVAGGYDGLEGHVKAMSQAVPTGVLPQLTRVGRPTLLRSQLRKIDPSAEQVFVERFSAIGAKGADVLYVPAYDGEREVLAFASARADSKDVAHPDRLRRVAAHIGAGWRLRRRLGVGPPEALLRPSGAVEHALGHGAEARHALGKAVEARERARGPMRRRDPEGALSLWQGLAAGRWSLVDRMERGEPRYVAAYANFPCPTACSNELTPREAQVSELLSFGLSLKEIAYDLGLGVSAVGKAASRAREKLGLSSSGELAALVAGTKEREVGGATAASIQPTRLDGASLSDAEHEVALLVLRGCSNADIALRRRTSVRTVANLVQRVFRKFGVHSRTELALRLVTR
jgi:DNA-binding CsgD family transcriptional regulator